MKLFLKKGLLPFVLVLVLFLSSTNLFSLPIPPVRRYVTVTGAGSKDGSSWANAFDGTQLKMVMDSTVMGEIWVAKGTYLPTADNDMTISFQLKSGVAVYGGFAGIPTETSLTDRNWLSNATILSGDLGTVGNNTDNSDHILYNVDVDNTAILDGFTIRDGNAGGAGGGIYNTNSSPMISNCIITSNATQTSGIGAGVYNELSSAPTFTNCLFSLNNSDGNGGAIYNTGSSPVLINCTLSRNSATYGGGIYNENGSSPTIKNSIIWNNSASSDGKQVYAIDGTTTFSYSCVANVTVPSGISDLSGTGTFDLISIGNNIDTDPKFANFVNDFRLTGASPCLDLGLDADNSESTDLRSSGFDRKLDKTSGGPGTIDMGAYEYKVSTDPALPSVPKFFVKADATGANNGSSWTDAYTSLQSALAAAIPGYQIWVAKGTYLPDPTGIDQSISFNMKSGVAIYGGFAGTTETLLSQRNWFTNTTTLSGYITSADSTFRSFHIVSNSDVDSTAVLDGFTIKGGSADAVGGGIYNAGATGSSPTITNCIITNNTTASGGSGAGIYNDALSSPKFTNCVISYNTTDGNGGGIYNANSTPKFINCTITQNKATLGGGIYNDMGSNALVYNSIFWGNYFFTSGTGDGRQIYINDGTVTLFNSCYRNLSKDVSVGIAPIVDATDITDDPKFVDSGEGDFRIGGNSPCADSGNDSYNSETYDIRGTGFGRRLLKTDANIAGTIDMGAYEYKNLADPSCAPTPRARVVPDQSICLGNSLIIGGQAAISGHEYSWTSSPSGFTSTSATPTASPTVTTTYTLTEKITLTGCQNSHSVTITVTPGATVTSASSETRCNAVSGTYTATSSIATATFAWSRAAVSGINNAAASGTGATITETLVNNSVNPVNVVYHIIPSAPGCGAGIPKDVTVTVNPSAVISSSPTASWCNNTSNTYTATSSTTSGTVTFAWSRAAVTGITNAANSGTGSTITEMLTNTTVNPIDVHYLITPSVNGCTGVTKDVVVTVNPTAVINSPSTANWCSGVANTYKATSSTTLGTITYSWTRAAVTGISNLASSGTGAIITETLTNTTVNPIVVHYLITPSVNGCAGATYDVSVTVNPVSVVTSSATDNWCNGVSNTYTATTSSTLGTITFAWTRAAVTGISNLAGSGSSATITETLNNTTVNPVVVHYLITPSVNGCSGTTKDVAITVNPTAVISSLATANWCNGVSNTYNATTSTTLGTVTYAWTRAAVTGISNAAVTNGTGSAITETLTNTTVNPVVVHYLITPSVNGCAGTTKDVSITVNPTAVISSSSTANWCNNVSNTYTATTSTTSGTITFAWTRAAVTGISNAAVTNGTGAAITETLNNTTSEPVVVHYLITPSINGCAGTTFDLSVTVNPTATISSSPTANWCNGVSNSYTATTSTTTGTITYAWTRAVVAGISNAAVTNGTGATINETLTNTSVNPVVVHYLITPIINGCSGTTKDVSVTVNPTTVITSPATGNWCNAVSNTYTATTSTTSGTVIYTWTRAAVTGISNVAVTNGTGAIITETLVNTTSDPVVVHYLITASANGCAGTTKDVSVTVNPTITPAINGSASVCATFVGSAYSTPAVAGHSYSWTASGGAITAGASTNAITITWGAAGTGWVKVSDTTLSTGCVNTNTLNITINPLPAAVAGSDRTLCANTATTLGASAVTGSTYSWTSTPAGFTSTTANPTATAAATTTYKVIETDINGCVNTHNVVVTVPQPTLSGPTQVCESTAGNVYTTEAGMTSYTWTVSAGGIITAGGTSTSRTVTVYWTSAGSQTVKVNYTTSGGCVAPSPTVYNVNVSSLPVPTIAGTASVCVGSTGITYTTEAGNSGYSWNLSSGGKIVSGAGTNSIGVLWTASGPQTVSVNYTDPYGCTGATETVKNVTVNPLPTPNISGPSTACAFSSGNVYSTETGMTGYVWSVSAGGTITAGGTATDPTITVTWNTAGDQTVSVNYRNTNGCTATAAKVKAVTVNPVLTPVITGAGNACAASTAVTYSTQSGMDSYKWTVSSGGTIKSGAGTNTVTVDWPGTGAQQISVNFIYPTGCSSPTATVKKVDLYDLPVPTITGSAAVCAKSAGITYTTESGMTGYTWKISAGGTITAGAGTEKITVTWNTAGAQTVSVNYANANGCSAITPTVKNVTVNDLPVPVITGLATVCAKTVGNSYSTESGMTGYTWNISAGGTITSGSGTNQIAVSWNTAGAQTVSVNYVNTKGCTALAPSINNVTVNPLVGTIGTITGTTSLCGGTQGVYSVAAVTNATTYVWTLPAGATIASGSGTPTITVNFAAKASSGNISVYASNNCGNSNTATLAIQVTQLVDDAGIISGPSSVCQGSTGLIFSVPKITNATSYTWSLPTGATIISGANTNSIVADLSMSTVSGQVSVYGSNSCGKGAVSPAFTLTVNAIPPKPVITPSGTSVVSNAQLGNQWYYSATADGAGSAIQGANSQSYTPTQNGWYWTVVTLNNCSSATSNRHYRLKAGEQNRYNLYPVPNNGEFTVAITTPDEQQFSILVYDQLGKKMYEHTDFVINGDFRQVLNLRPIPTGIYTIIFLTKDGKEVRKFNVKK